jgi:hypothetical protein
MAHTVIIHVANEEAFIAEMDQLPNPGDNVVIFSNPRKRDGRPLSYVDENATLFVYPWSRINYLEVMAGRSDRDELVEFFRTDSDER